MGTRQTFDAVVTVASWEPRFLLGLQRILAGNSVSRIRAYFVQEYADRTRDTRDRLRRIATESGTLKIMERGLAFDEPTETWNILREDLGKNGEAGKVVLVDLTTMPREIIWSTLFWLEASGTETHYVYNRPTEYGSGWLAKDPDEARLVYKLAGVQEVGKPTALVAVTGFDENRCRQAVEFYEPARVLLAAPSGEQYENNVRNFGPAFATGGTPIEHAEIDAFAGDHGYEALREPVGKLVQRYNVILCSFGPKPTAIALYRLQREFAQCALAYIGCKEYNMAYLDGVGFCRERTFGVATNTVNRESREDGCGGAMRWSGGPSARFRGGGYGDCYSRRAGQVRGGDV